MKETSCPKADLPELIQDGLSSAATDRLMRHLESCSVCQSEIELLSADISWWKAVRAGLVECRTDDECRLLEVVPVDCSIDPLLGNQSQSEHEHSLPAILDMLESPTHPEMLGRLDEFEIEKMIGVGGMGVVFKGFDHELNRPVAIKAMLPRFSSNGIARKRFLREAQAAAAICHENVVAIHRIQSTSEVPYLVMAFVAGDSLQAFVEKSGPFEIQEMVRIGIQIASGLSAAHLQGLVHRDIKPANILLENGCNKVQITDFGLARAAEDAQLTRSGTIAGSPSYMSPEQAIGGPIDARSDLFSLGSVLYFLATGRSPFRGENPLVILNLICNLNPLDVRELNPNIPREMAYGIHRLLEKSPDSRFRSAKEVKGFLESLLAHLMNPAQTQSPKIRLPKSLKQIGRWRLRLIARCLVSAATLVGIAAIAMSLNSYFPTQEGNIPASSEYESLLEHVRSEVQLAHSEYYQFDDGRETTGGWPTEISDTRRRVQSLIDEHTQIQFDNAR